MKKLFVCLFMLMVPVCAMAQEDIRFYLRGDAGFTYSSAEVMDFDMGGFQGMYNLAIGGQKGRVRAELAYQERATVSEAFSSLFSQTIASLDARALLANAYYTAFDSKYFDLYVGAGAGVNKYQGKLEYLDLGTEKIEDGYSATLGLYAGMSFDLNYIVLDLGLDYYYTFKPSMNSLVPKIGMRVVF